MRKLGLAFRTLAILALGLTLCLWAAPWGGAHAAGKAPKGADSVVEGEAQKAERGLWAAKDLPHPTKVLAGALKASARPQ